MAEPLFSLLQGSQPLLISMPHVGSEIPQALRSRLVERALVAEDTDWHLDKLYAFARDMGASMLVPRFSRFVIDLNRPPENTPMYPGVNNTGLCPTRFFSGDALYRDGMEPGESEIAQRVALYWQPYHEALQDELQRIRSVHGHVVLFDAHSIKSTLPWLFEGQLPDLNLGTASGQSCAASLRQALSLIVSEQPGFTHAVDGRFKGGYITRHYGRPENAVHAVQLEMTWLSYMRECAPYAWAPELAAGVQPVLRQLLSAMCAWQPGDAA